MVCNVCTLHRCVSQWPHCHVTVKWCASITLFSTLRQSHNEWCPECQWIGSICFGVHTCVLCTFYICRCEKCCSAVCATVCTGISATLDLQMQNYLGGQWAKPAPWACWEEFSICRSENHSSFSPTKHNRPISGSWAIANCFLCNVTPRNPCTT